MFVSSLNVPFYTCPCLSQPKHIYLASILMSISPSSLYLQCLLEREMIKDSDSMQSKSRRIIYMKV